MSPRVVLRSAAIVAILLVSPAGASPTPPNAMAIGANIDGVADWSSTLPFVNIVRQSRAWGSAASPWDGAGSTGADTWPNTSSFGSCYYGPQGGPHTWGTWLLSFQGRAAVVPSGNMHGASIEDAAYDAATDTTTASLVLPANADSCDCIMLSFYNASTVAGGPGIKDLKVLQPGYTLAQADDFSAPLLALLGRADVLRFIDWTRVIGDPTTEWAQRTLPSSYSYTGGGSGGAPTAVPWEVCFRLANLLKADAWINVPAHASDNYVLQLATLANASLDPSLSLYVEFSNEVWK